MLVLGIESSCDDTSIALLDSSKTGHFVINKKTASQIEIHKKYGGVVPEIAGRMHAEKIVPLIEEVLKGQPKPDAIAVTSGPGLITGLLVGVQAARTLSYSLNIPLIPINHINGHIHSVEISPATDQPRELITQFPALCLVVSGGHTELILMKSHTEYEIIGKTKDDAAGECFDKVAKLLGFEYPGGPQISKQAVGGNTQAIDFPRPMIEQPNFDFSFSGLKTSALYWLRDNKLNTTHTLQDFCASFEQAIVDVLIAKTLRAAQEHGPQTIILAGGVSANKKLRETLETEVKKILPQIPVLLSTPGYSMDNGAMIAVAGYYKAIKKEFTPWENVNVDPNWKVDQAPEYEKKK